MRNFRDFQRLQLDCVMYWHYAKKCKVVIRKGLGVYFPAKEFVVAPFSQNVVRQAFPPSIFSLTKQQLKVLLQNCEFHVAEGACVDKKLAADKSLQLRAAVIFRNLYPRAGRRLGDVHQRSYRFLTEKFTTQLPARIFHVEGSPADGSQKFIIELTNDGLKIESVLIPERGRSTICISTQVGCAQACVFCSTGKMGLARSLTVDEIVAQVVLVGQWLNKSAGFRPLTNIVFMGMGEPLDNLPNVLQALDILTDPDGLAFSHNKITVSTVGLLPQLQEFLTHSKACLALSLHSPFDSERTRVLPVNKANPLQDVLNVLRSFGHTYAKPFMIQYTLIRGVNDTLAHATELCRVLEGLNAKINLIPLNEHRASAYRRPQLGAVYQFQNWLKEKGMVATVRLSKGRDVGAACGQLVQLVDRGSH